MLVKVLKVKGLALSWLVAMAEGYDHGWLARQLGNPDPRTRAIPEFSTDWGQGGPLVEREWAALTRQRDALALRGISFDDDGVLVGFMRCFVINHLGEEFDVPEELL